MQRVRFRQLRWEKGIVGLEHGIRGGWIQRNMVAGSPVVTTPAKLMLSFWNEDGRNVITIDIIEQVKSYTGWQRMNDNRVTAVERFLREREVFLWDENTGCITID